MPNVRRAIERGISACDRAIEALQLSLIEYVAARRELREELSQITLDGGSEGDAAEAFRRSQTFLKPPTEKKPL